MSMHCLFHLHDGSTLVGCWPLEGWDTIIGGNITNEEVDDRLRVLLWCALVNSTHSHLIGFRTTLSTQRSLYLQHTSLRVQGEQSYGCIENRMQ